MKRLCDQLCCIPNGREERARCVPHVAVQFAPEFTSVAAGKLALLQAQGGRVVELVLEDPKRGRACLDRFGRVTWSDEANARHDQPEPTLALGAVPALVVPDGFRLLETGERIRKGDLYCKGPGHSWHECRAYGVRWNAEGFWPIARRRNAGVRGGGAVPLNGVVGGESNGETK